VVNAFRQGAFGPDLGYFPGGFRPLSDLAHCLGAGDLARTLVSSAHTPLERGFAWGWATHVLADGWIHPLIGQAVGELVHGERTRFVDGDSEPTTHVLVESGLDAVYARRHPALRSLRLGGVFDDLSIGFLEAAYRRVYGAGLVDREVLLRSHRTAVRRAAQGLALAGFVARGLPTDRIARAGSARPGTPDRGFRTVLGRRSRAMALLLPLPPPAWLLRAVDGILRAFLPAFLDAVDAGLVGLGNPNLDTGRPEHESPEHGGHLRARRFLGLPRPEGASCP
jgi:hypothetical protein